MEIYVEYVLLDNIVINFLILEITGKILHQQSRFIFKAISSLLGAIVAVTLPFISLVFGYQLLIKLLLGIFMVLIAYKMKTIKKFLATFLTFLSMTFLMGGASVCILLAMGGKIYQSTSGFGYDAILPLGAVLAVVAVYVRLISAIAGYIYRRRDCLQFMAKVKVEFRGKTCEFEGFIDSGNRLFDTQTGLPVMIVSYKALKPVLVREFLVALMKVNTNPNKKLKTAHYIQFTTLAGEAKPMLVFEPDLVEYEYNGKKVISKVLIGVSYSEFADSKHYDALLHPSMIV